LFATYLRRELGNRTRQTVIVALGMALAIGLVIVVSSISAGVRDAQSSVLESIYGVGTDLTVTKEAESAAADGTGGPRFEFGQDAGSADGETRSLAASRLQARMGVPSFDAAALATVQGTDGVAAATATLSLTSTSFSGELPDVTQFQGTRPGFGSGGEPQVIGGADGAGGSAFQITSFSVDGVDVAGSAVGPLASAEVSDGRGFAAEDAGQDVAVLDADYATEQDLTVGDTISIADTDFEIVGVVSSTSPDGTTGANVYIPLDVAQALAGLDGQVSTIYVQAQDASGVGALQTALEDALPDNAVKSQADLAESVSGSLSTASSLVSNLGLWLSALVLAAAFVIAILFTVSGVARRTRELGTLKAIGWSNARITRQVAGESLVQGLIGGAAGVAIGLLGVWAVNLVGPTLSASTGGFGGLRGGGQPVGAVDSSGVAGDGSPAGIVAVPFGGGSGATTTDIVLSAPVTVEVVLLAVGLAVLGGLLAGAIGAWRAARLRPAAALRSVA